MRFDYLIEALAPLVFRSGKPFGSQTGADGASFPLPSSLAGLIRTVHADQQGHGGAEFDASLRGIAVRGPLLARREADGRIVPLLPRPADALYLLDGGQPEVIRLAPAALPDGAGCDLQEGLLPVQMRRQLDGKPVGGPQFWALDCLMEWGGGSALAFEQLRVQGQMALPAEERTHVALDAGSGAADAGRLFQTGGIDLAAGRADAGWTSHDLVFIAQGEVDVQATLASFGGERRMVRIHAASVRCWPSPPALLEAQIRQARGLRLTLASPAILGGGHLPAWLDADTLEGVPPDCPGLRLKLRAAAIERWLPVSGWDLATNKPRAMRKAVAAGAVYWFELMDEPPAGFVDTLWFGSVSDHPQDRRDGFGLALPAAWTPNAD